MEELHFILKTMDVPPLRINDLEWLRRNLQINNGDHPDLKLAQSFIGILMAYQSRFRFYLDQKDTK